MSDTDSDELQRPLSFWDRLNAQEQAELAEFISGAVSATADREEHINKAKVEENRFHWHHQKSIESANSVSAYFLDRIAELTDGEEKS